MRAGLGHDLDEVYAQYVGPGRELRRALVLPVLTHIPAKRLGDEAGLVVSMVKVARNGHAVPHGRTRETLTGPAATFSR